MTQPLTVPIAVDIVALTVIDHTLHALVVRRGIEPFKDHLALPGGFLREGEQTDEAAARELEEETGITPPGHLEQLRTYGPQGRDPRGPVLSVAYLLLAPSFASARAGGDASGALWHPVDALLTPDSPLAFDHASILADGVERAPRSNTPPWPRPSAAPNSRSPSCARRTRPSGVRRSTRATSTARQRRQLPSSSRRAAPCAKGQVARLPSTASSPASTTPPSSSIHPCAARPPRPRHHRARARRVRKNKPGTKGER